MSRTCSVSIDVDPIPCYYRIHALGSPPPGLRAKILCASLPRFAAVLGAKNIKATFFVVAEDIDVDALGQDAIDMRAVLRELIDEGHEIANHSYSHPYELARLPPASVAEEMSRAHRLLSKLVGESVTGFRAPGYDLSPEILRVLVELGYRYDSSVFPAPVYYAAKALVMAGLHLIGRPSGAVMTNARALVAPIVPYEADLAYPWRPGVSGIVELPVAVTRRTRTPVIGTNLLLAPRALRSHWLSSMTGRDFFNFELHGIDLCGAQQDGMPDALVRRQPDLRISLDRKINALAEVLDSIAARGMRFATLREVAETYRASAP